MGTARKIDAAARDLSSRGKEEPGAGVASSEEWNLRKRALERWENEGGRIKREPPRDARFRGRAPWAQQRIAGK
jgi:hypothetical protein